MGIEITPKGKITAYKTLELPLPRGAIPSLLHPSFEFFGQSTALLLRPRSLSRQHEAAVASQLGLRARATRHQRKEISEMGRRSRERLRLPEPGGIGRQD